MSSTNATVTCTSATARFVFNRVQNVHISGMTFQGCRNTAISMLRVTSASILRSTFIGNQAVQSGYGGCLTIVSSVSISESEFQYNRTYYTAGAIYAYSSTVRIKRSQFSYNSIGGAISALFSNITVNGSAFTNNSAHRFGGAIRLAVQESFK